MTRPSLTPAVTPSSSVKVLEGCLVPAYGRDYKSQASVLEDFASEKDFLIQALHGPLAPWDGRPTNSVDLYKSYGPCRIQVRYNKLKSVVHLEVLGREPFQYEEFIDGQVVSQTVLVMNCRIHRG